MPDIVGHLALEIMPETGTEAEKPHDSGADSAKLQGSVILSGQLSADNGLREVLEIVTTSKDVQYGLLRILSKDVRGYIGVSGGVHIVGAHVTSTREYGIPALRKLLVANKGMFVFMALAELPIELRQDLGLSVDDLLNWRPPGFTGAPMPLLREALASLTAGRVESIGAASECGEALQKGLLQLPDDATEEAEFASYMAWGGEAPVLSLNLARLSGQLGLKNEPTGPKPVIENILHTIEEASPDTPAQPMQQQFQQDQQQFQQQFQQQQRFEQPQIEMPPPPPGNRAQQPVSEPAPPAQKWNLDELESIPTPKTESGGTASGAGAYATSKDGIGVRQTGPRLKPATAAPPAAPIDAQSQVNEDLEKALAGGRPDAALTTSQRVKQGTKRDDELNAIVTQRMQVVDPKTFINDGPKQVMSPAQRRKFEIMAIGGGIVGVGLFLALGQQVFNITMGTQKYHNGIRALNAGDNVLAQVELTGAIKLNGVAPAYLYRAVANTRLGQMDNAARDYNELIERQPNNVLALAGRASLRIKQKDYKRGLEDCNRIVAMKPDYYDGYRLRCLIYCMEDKYSEALVDAGMYLKHAPETEANNKGRAEVLQTRAYAYLKLKKLDEAIRDYSEAIGLLGDSAGSKLYASRAIAYKQAKAYKKALSDAEIAIKLDPSDSTLYKLRGQCHGGAGDAAKSAADLDKAVKLTPSVETFFLRGEARLAAKDFEGALEDFEYVLSVNPNHKLAKVKFDLAKSNLVSKVKPLSIAQDATTSAPEPAPVKLTGDLVQKGYSALRAGQVGQAITLLAAAVKANPSNPTARRYLAYAFAQKGDNANAISQFSSLATLENLNVEDRLSYGKTLVAARNNETAIEVYNSILVAQPNNHAARMGLINAYLQSGFAGKAAQLAQQGIENSGGAPQTVAAYQGLLRQAQSHR